MCASSLIGGEISLCVDPADLARDAQSLLTPHVSGEKYCATAAAAVFMRGARAFTPGYSLFITDSLCKADLEGFQHVSLSIDP